MRLPDHSADVALTLIALAAVVIVLLVLRGDRQRTDGLSRRFAFVLQVSLLLLIGRIGFWG